MLIREFSMGIVEMDRLPNGYWTATIRIPERDGRPAHEQSAGHFHDEQEASTWGIFMLNFWADAMADASGEKQT